MGEAFNQTLQTNASKPTLNLGIRTSLLSHRIQHLLHADTLLGTLEMVTHSIPTPILCAEYGYDTFFTDEETEARRYKNRAGTRMQTCFLCSVLSGNGDIYQTGHWG